MKLAAKDSLQSFITLPVGWDSTHIYIYRYIHWQVRMPRVHTGEVHRILRSGFQIAHFPVKEIGWLWQSCQYQGLNRKISRRRFHPNTVSRWARLCHWRLKTVPLQYLIGWQPFGSLEILCRPNVLIPRWETEEWVSCLGQSILKCYKEGTIPPHLHLTDFCTGSGCIPLLLLKMTRTTPIFKCVKAVDISQHALNLTQRNLVHNHLPKNSHNKFQTQLGNIMDQNAVIHHPHDKIDILTCNPPYISTETFQSEVEESVKRYEPHLALIGDLEFYENLVERWLPHINSFVYELGSFKQFHYVKSKIASHNTNHPKDKWGVGIKFDSNGQLRCVFGFNMKMKPIFQDYGQLIIQI